MSKNNVDTDIILRKAVDAFSDINSRIQSLIECSAKDFDTLNQNFKDYFNKIKDLTENTDCQLVEIIDLPNNEMNEVRRLLEQSIINADILLKEVAGIHKNLSKIAKGLSYTYLDINKAKQNISTLKLLTTNIQFEPLYQNMYTSLIKSLIELSEFCRIFEKEIIAIENHIKASIDLTEKITNKQLPLCIEQVKNLYGLIDELDEKKSHCLAFKDALDTLKNEKSISSSEIITNLQFQDIIRQKIEHVQQAHEALLQNLTEVTTSTLSAEEKPKNLPVQLIFQIRDIGSLQTAQLVHANSEYQNSVSNITNKFSELDEIFSEITQLTQSINSNKSTSDKVTITNLRTSIDHLQTEFEILIDQGEKLKKMLDSLFKMQIELEKSHIEIVKHIQLIGDSSENIESISSRLNTVKANTVDPINQLQSNLKVFKKSSYLVSEFIENDKEKLGTINKSTVDNFFISFNNLQTKFGDLLSHSKKLTKNKNTDRDNINTDKVNPVIGEVNFKVEDVKYYKVFEQEVEEIISQLNSLISMINLEEFEGEYGSEELDRIKQLYTMQSEREIHNQQFDDISKKKEDTGENGDIELF